MLYLLRARHRENVDGTEYDVYYLSSGGNHPDILYHFDEAVLRSIQEHNAFRDALTNLKSPRVVLEEGSFGGSLTIKILALAESSTSFSLNIDLPKEGPMAYENWKAYLRGVKSEYAAEYALYTDAYITGEVTQELGPYRLLNARAFTNNAEGTLQPAIGLQVETHRSGIAIPDMEKKDESRYHGGTPLDEIAALVSLALGIRLQVGSMTREFHPGGDPRGRPWSWKTGAEPALLRQGRTSVIPNVTGSHSLNEPRFLSLLSLFPALMPEDAVALVRAARLYQSAVWAAESDPSQAWLYIISALETAANRWRPGDDAPLDRLTASRPELHRLLMEKKDEDFTARVAALIAPYMGATSKFVSFVMEFLPEPPAARPPEYARLDWTPKSIKKYLQTIYAYRSKALHGGIPFPPPMGEQPTRLNGQDAFSEIPQGLGMSALGGVWRITDTPMLLHTFEYIARNALLAWWQSMATPEVAVEASNSTPEIPTTTDSDN